MTSRIEKINALEKRLSALRSEAAKSNLAARARSSKAARAADTRRKILLGGFVLSRIEGDIRDLKIKGLAFADYLSRPEDRALFLPPKSAAALEGAAADSAPTPRVTKGVE